MVQIATQNKITRPVDRTGTLSRVFKDAAADVTRSDKINEIYISQTTSTFTVRTGSILIGHFQVTALGTDEGNFSRYVLSVQ